MAHDLPSSLQKLLVDFLKPLDEAAHNPRVLIDWLAALGYTNAVAGHPSMLQIAQHGQALIGKLEAFDAQTLQSSAGLVSLLGTGREAATILQELRVLAADPAMSQFAEGLAEEVMSFLLASYVRRKHPTAFRVASLLTIIDARETATMEPAIVGDTTTLRYARVLDHFRFETLGDLIHHPGSTLKGIYFPNDLAQGADAWNAAQRLFPSVAFLADAVGLSCLTAYRSNVPAPPLPDLNPDEPIHDSEDTTDPEDPATPDVPDADQVDDQFVSLPPVPDSYFAANDPVLRLDIVGDAANNGLALEMRVASQKHPSGMAGLILEFAGNINQTETHGQWKCTFSASGEIPAFVIGVNRLSLAPSDQALADGSAKLLIEYLPPAGSSVPAFVFGSATGTRLELGAFRLAVDLSYTAAHLAASIDMATTSASLVLAPDDGDSFLASLLPAQGTRSPLDFGLTWSSDRGLAVHGSAGLDVTIPIGVSISGVTLPTLYLSLQASNAGLMAEASASIAASIGPVRASIDRVGMTSALTFPHNGGNVGIADLDASFKPPSGVGLAIDASAVVGGGFLSFDPQKQEYSGMLELQIAERIAVKGIGLLTTQLPDGRQGYSLVVIIFTQGFEPIQLGLGFTLTGIGGLLAINRTFDEAALRAGLKNHTLDSILFPKDPIRNAPQILSNLNKVFPPAKGHHLFGPMAQIAWGTPPLITANLALVLEFGARLRLLILAQVVAILPKRENDLVRLQMDAIGVIDFDQGTAELDATLHDSRLLKKFVLTGDMAMRLKWEGSPNFALAIGGLHPAFNPPPNFPKLERIAINLCAGDNPRFRCEAYFALTSNTVQFGARAELYASASGFSIQGETGFDVLIQLDPFHFLADFYAQLQLKRGSTNLFKVRVEGALSGPRPLHIKAKVTFEILWWDYSVRIDKTLVEGELPPLPEPVDVLPRLKEALGNPGNWKGQLPENQRPMVTLRAKPEAPNEVLLHPLGTLTVKQGVVPLNLDISRFGQAVPAGARRFTISSVSLSDQKQTIQPVKDFFAPAQFLEMSDDEKLSRPSFEPMDAGVSFGSNEFNFSADTSDWLEVKAIAFETIIVDKQTNTSRPSEPEGSKKLYTLSPELLGKQALFGAAGTSDLRRTGKAKYRTTMGKYQVAKEGWSIVATDNLTVQSLPGIEAGKSTTYSEAAQALRKLKQENPAQAGGLKILRLSEIALRVESPGN